MPRKKKQELDETNDTAKPSKEEKPKRRRSKKSEEAAVEVERQSERYVADTDAPEAATIDRRPYYTPAMEKEEERINREADERAASGEVDADGQREMFPRQTKEDIEAAPHVRSTKVKLMLTVEREGEKPIQLPILLATMPGDRVQELCILSLKSRRNTRLIEAALDLPEKEEPTTTRPVAESLAEVEARQSKSSDVPTDGGTAGADQTADAAGHTEPSPELASADNSSAVREPEAAEPDAVEEPDQGDAEPAHVDTVDHEAEVKGREIEEHHFDEVGAF